MPAHKVYPAKPVAYRIVHPGSRLSKIDNELGAANRRIEADRHHGYLTAMETSKVRAEERAIRTAAVATAHRNGGRLPEAKFVSLAGPRHRSQPDDPSLREQFRARLILL